MAYIPPVIGASVVAAVQPTDPLGIAGWLAIGTLFGTWTIANVIPTAAGGSIPLISAAGVVSGTGKLVCGPSPVLGAALAAACLCIDPTGIAKWLKIAQRYTDILSGDTGAIDPSGLIGYTGPVPPTNGPVTGFGSILVTANFDFHTAIDVVDEPGIAKWTAVGAVLKSALAGSIVTPLMSNPAPVGPVVGTGTIS